MEQQSEAERQQIEAAWKSALQTLSEGLQNIARDALTSTKDDINQQLIKPVRQIKSSMANVSKILAGADESLRQAEEAREKISRKATKAAWAILAASLIMAIGATWYTTSLGQEIAGMIRQRADLEAALARLPTPPTTVTGEPGLWARIDATNIVQLQGRPGKWARLK